MSAPHQPANGGTNGGEEEAERRPPMWKLGPFWSLTADPYLDSNDGVPESDVGVCCAVLRLMLRDCSRLSPWAGPTTNGTTGIAGAAATAGGTSVPSLLAKCGDLAAGGGNVGDSVDNFDKYVSDFLADLEGMAVGDAMLVPGGWSGPTGSACLVYVAERLADTSYALVVCNASPDGLGYHPSIVDDARPADKVAYRTCLRIDDVAGERFLDKTFWAVVHSLWIRPSEFHRAEVLYDVLLPWLSGVPTLSDALRAHYAELRSGSSAAAAPASAAADGPLAGGAKKGDNPFWRTPMRSASSSAMRNTLEAVRYYLVRYANSSKADLKRFTTLLKAEALGMALADLNDAQTEEPPNDDERVVLELACRTVAHAALKVVGTEGWGAADASRLVGAVKAKLAELAELEEEADASGSDGDDSGSGVGDQMRPDPFQASDLAQADSRFHGVRVSNDDVERYAGPATEPRTSRSVDFLKVAGGKVRTVEDAVAVLTRCKRVCEDLDERCRDGSSYSSRVALQLQVAQIIGHVFTSILPVPVANPEVLAAQRLSGTGSPPGNNSADASGGGAADDATARQQGIDNDAPGRMWSRGFPSRDLQLNCLSLIHQLTLTYARAWQSFDAPSRSFESEKAVVSLCLLSVFDCVLRHDTHGVDTASVLREDGGFCLSTTVCVANLSLYRLAGAMELHSPKMALARARCLAYFETVQRSSRYSDLFVFRMPTDKIEVKKYGTSILFLRKLMERCGYELVPRNNPQPPPEIESLMEWLTSPSTPLARDHREFGMLRDMACFYKFLATMESRESELQRQRIAASEYVSWSLSFEDTSIDRGGSFRGAGGNRGLRWEVLNYRGLDLDTADVQVTFSDRKVFFGEGLVHSPADITSLLNHKGTSRPTEDDILHADTLPSYGDTLSRQESEMLMSYLTVPYLRIPLCLAFFATGDRVTYLFSHGLQALLRAVLFDSAEWVPHGHEPKVEMVPVTSGGFRSRLDDIMTGEQVGDGGGSSVGSTNGRKPAVLGTSDGLLLNELRHAPEATLRPLMKMLASLNDLAEASVYSPDASLSLYLIELALDVQAFFDEDGVRVSDERQKEMASLLTKDCRAILRHWLREAAEADDLETMCMIHSYLALIWTHTSPRDLTASAVGELMGSLCFVRNWHGFGLGDSSVLLGYGSSTNSHAPAEQRLLRFMQAHGVNIERVAKGSLSKYVSHARPLYLRVGMKTVRVPNLASSSDEGSDINESAGRKKKRKKGKLMASVPEQKLIAMLQMQRGSIVAFLEALSKASNHLANRVLSEIATVALDTKANWLSRKRGREGEERAVAGEKGSSIWTSSSRGSWLSPDKEMTLDLQMAQVMWRNDELKPLPDSMTNFPDYHALFGRQQMHCGLVAMQQHRHWVHVVGTSYDLLLWDEPEDKDQGIEAPREITAASVGQDADQIGDGLWICPMCTYRNQSPSGGMCQMCGTSRNAQQGIATDASSTQAQGQAGDADDMKSKSPSAIEHRGVTFDRELDPFDEESLKKFNNEGEEWALKLLVAGIRGHYKDKLPFKLLLPTTHVKADDCKALAMAGVITQHDPEDQDDDQGGLPPPMQGRGSGAAFSLQGIGDRTPQQQGGGMLRTTWKEFVMYRERGLLQVFNLASHGRKLYRQLVYSSDSRLALYSLEPSKSVFGACGDLKTILVPDSSLVITRSTGSGAGVETLVPGRLLTGTVPGALLEAYRFWHSSLDNVIRGEPLDVESTWFGGCIIEVMADRSIVQRQLSRKEQREMRMKLSAGVTGTGGTTTAAGQRRLVVESTSTDATAAMETDDAEQPQFPETAVMDLVALGFSSAAARLALMKCNGNSAFAAEWLFNPDNTAQVASAEDREQISETLFKVVGHGSVHILSAPAKEEGNVHRWRTPDTLGYGEEITVVERSGNWLRFVDPKEPEKDCWVLAFDPENGTILEPVGEQEGSGSQDIEAEAVASAVKSAVEEKEATSSRMDIDDNDPIETEGVLRESKLVNMLDDTAGKDSSLFHLLSLFVKVEDLSHMLVWADVDGGKVTHIELPRLKLKIAPRNNGHLHLTDQAGWFICKQNKMSRKLLDCHSLLLMNSESEVQFLVPNHQATRPKIKGKAFSTKLLCDRGSFSWLQTMDTRFYLYKVHTSGTFLVSQELAASIYLVHLKLLQRRYKEVFALAPSCTVDVPFAPDEGFVWGQLKDSMDDRHPDAHACRLRLSLAIMYANGHIRTPWEAHVEFDAYLRKLPRVSAACRLTKEEEGKACQLAASGTPLIKNRLAALNASSSTPLVHADFAAPSPRVGGSPWHKVQSRSLSFYNNHGTSLKRIHFRPEIGQGGFDNYSMDVIYNELVTADEESGANRQVGFAFLYQLIVAGNVPGAVMKPLVTGEILARYLHLKLSRWGRESVATGEVEVSNSRHMAQLSALLHCQHQRGRQQITWPNLPSDEQSVALASNGVNLYTEPGVSSGIKTWLDLVDMEFQSAWPAIVESNDASRRAIERQELKGAPVRLCHDIQPAVVDDTGCHLRVIEKGNTPLVSMMISPLHHLHQGFLTEGSAQATRNAPKEKLPFDLYSHPAAQPAVACDILKRLEEDVKGYSISTRKNLEPVLKSSEETDLTALINSLEGLQKDDMEFVHQTIASLEQAANRLGENSDVLALMTAASHRDTISFELLTQALLSRTAHDDLQSINPALSSASIQNMLDETISVLVRVNRISQSSRTVSLAKKLLQEQREESSGNFDDTRRVFRAKQLTKDLASNLSVRRWYIEQGDQICFDPRFLVFEYVFDILLRERQVEIVQSFANDVAEGRSHVQQMIMGAGKTTVVAPLLTLLLADGNTLVTQVMPSSLLEQTRHIMRSRFAAVIRKRVFTLEFDRGCEDDVEVALKVFTKLNEAKQSRAVVCASPDAVKSLFLKFVEHLHSLENVDTEVLTPSSSMRQNKEIVALRQTMQSRSDMSDAIVPIFDLWREGVLIMDEVDVLLHPLRSELNFPIGNKDPIDLSGFRWDLPMALLRVFFPADAAEEIEAAAETPDGSGNRTSYKEEQQLLLKEIQRVVEAGYAQHALQRNPHLVLLDEDFYRRDLKSLAARWAALWILAKCSDIPQDIELIAQCLYLDDIENTEACNQTPELQSIRSAVAQVRGVSMKLLNLGRDWIRVLLPHVLSKIDRVSFGILSPKDLANVDQTRMPISRKLMAVPFVGKDVPSRSSEFAHPDVVIGLSVLGYRYEGLRESDIRRIVMQLKADFARQVGPRDQRPACLLFRSWLEHAARHLGEEEESQQLPVLPLPLFQANDPKQLKRLHQIICKEDRVISYYLQQHVFPACMNFQNIKISACGHELGSDMLFQRRVGFSGTPSNLLPTDLGRCLYEPGSDGKVMHVLSSPEVVTLERKNDWTARSLLRDVAAGSADGGGPFHALIDTGALITGMDNEEVARYLLDHLPASLFEGVVYLDHADRKMFLQRSSGKSLHLSQCGVDPSRRFSFYDQVHTTGMDIKQAPDARAVVTLGKDMTFRDFAQGSFRMRGIGNGQTIQLYLIPEVEHLIRTELHQNKDDTPFSSLDVPAWLLVNSMRTETVQHSMLSLQELFNCWRKEALSALLADVKLNSPLVPKETRDNRTAPTQSNAQRLRRFLDAGPDSWITKCVSLFREPVGFVVPDGIPAPQPFSEKINGLIDENSHFVKTSEARELVLGVAGRVSYAKDIANEALEAEIVNENEQEQQQQQEEEAEEEQEKVSRFTRDDEQANPWSSSHLNETPTCIAGEAPFYRFREFAVRSDQPKLAFPENLLLSDNFFRPRWIGLGDRRLKNVLVVLEWYPKSFKMLLAKLVPLLHQHLVAEGLQPTPAALRALSVATMPTTGGEVALRRRFVDRLVTPETAQAVGMGPEDCFYVAISLAEAESLRRILHTKQGDTTSAFSLLSIEDSSCIDSTPTARAAASSDQLAARELAASCLRFVNGDMHYTSAELSVLQNAFAGSPLNDRIQFFEQCLRLRRREKYLWGDTPLAKFFTEEKDWHLLDARAKLQQFGLSLVRSLRLPGNTIDLLSMFSRLDTDGDGALSHGEMQRLLEELRLGFSPADISVIIKIIDSDDKHKILWEVLVKALMLPPDLTSRQQDDEAMEEEKTVWACSNCTFRFNDPKSQECEVCGYGWDGCLHVPADKWMCDPSFGGCTFFNSKDSFFCSVCDKSNPSLRNVRF